MTNDTKGLPGYSIDEVKNMQVISGIAASHNTISPHCDESTVSLYKNLYSEYFWWDNKCSDLNTALQICTSYNIDIDYSDLVLNIRLASANRDRLHGQLKLLEKDYPGIEYTKDIILRNEDVRDPIVDRWWKNLERYKLHLTPTSNIKLQGTLGTLSHAAVSMIKK